MTEERMALVELLQKSGDGDILRAVAEAVLQIPMEAGVEGLIGAGRHERTGDRLNHRNGYRDRSLDTRLSPLQLRIPKLRQGRTSTLPGARRLARGGSHRPAPACGLGALRARPGGRALPGGRQARPGYGPAQYPLPGLALRGVRARGGKRLAERLEIHHTPKHGSWLNMAEIELSALGRDLPDRVGDRATLERHVQAWQHRRNAAATRADWQFTTKDARIKLRKLYPTMES